MNICVVTQQVKKTISGIGLHTNNLVKALLKDGHRVWVMAPEDQRPATDLPYTYVSVPAPIFYRNQARSITLGWSFARALNDLLQDAPIDLVHFTDAREALFFRSHLPVVGNINDTYSAELHTAAYYRKYYSDWWMRWLYYRVIHTLEGVVLRRLDAVIANSQFTAGIMRSQYNLSPAQLFVCYKSIDPVLYQPAVADRSNHAPYPPRILFVGTNMQRKGLPSLIQAAPAVIRCFPNAEFWVVGEDAVLPRMKSLCADLGVLQSFRFLGWKSQQELIQQIYGQTSLFVMPSLTESLGMVFLEAMASGIPVIGTSVGGIPEIIQDGRNGLTVPPDQPEALSQAIINLLRDPLLYAEIQKRGFETAERFNVSKMMEGTYRIYDEALRAKGSIA